MVDLYLLSQILAIICCALGLWRLQLKHHRSIILSEAPICALWIAHFSLVGGIAGLIINCFYIFRSLARCYLNKKYRNAAIYTIMVCIWTTCLYFYQGPHSLLPPIAASIATYGILRDCRRQLTNSIIIHNLLWVLYGIAIASPFACLSPALGIVSCLIGKYRHEGRRRKIDAPAKYGKTYPLNPN